MLAHLLPSRSPGTKFTIFRCFAGVIETLKIPYWQQNGFSCSTDWSQDVFAGQDAQVFDGKLFCTAGSNRRL